MHKAWNKEGKFFGQSYEETDVVDAAVLIMPLVFFMQAVRSSAFFHDKSQVTIALVRSKVCEHLEADFKITCKRGIDVERGGLSFFSQRQY